MSSIREKVAQVMKQKKVERRHAIEKRNEPENNKLEHIEAKVGGVSSEASGSDSPIVSEEVKSVVSAWKKATKKKPAAKKKAAKKS